MLLRKNFDVDYLCRQAILVSKQVKECILDYSNRSLDDLDCLIEYYTNYQELLSNVAMWNIAVCLGVYMGQVILKDRLKIKNFKWNFDENDIPIIIHQNKKWSISPIKIIYKRLTTKFDKRYQYISLREEYENFLEKITINEKEKEIKIIKGGDY